MNDVKTSQIVSKHIKTQKIKSFGCFCCVCCYSSRHFLQSVSSVYCFSPCTLVQSFFLSSSALKWYILYSCWHLCKALIFFYGNLTRVLNIFSVDVFCMKIGSLICIVYTYTETKRHYADMCVLYAKPVCCMVLRSTFQTQTQQTYILRCWSLERNGNIKT